VADETVPVKLESGQAIAAESQHSGGQYLLQQMLLAQHAMAVVT